MGLFVKHNSELHHLLVVKKHDNSIYCHQMALHQLITSCIARPTSVAFALCIIIILQYIYIEQLASGYHPNMPITTNNQFKIYNFPKYSFSATLRKFVVAFRKNNNPVLMRRIDIQLLDVCPDNRIYAIRCIGLKFHKMINNMPLKLSQSNDKLSHASISASAEA